jgi:multiple sugar transport system substrate-binding protein
MIDTRKPLYMPSRRRFLTGAAAGAAALGLYGAGFRPAFADLAAAGDWQKYKGTNLRLLLNNHWWTDAVKAKVSEFEQLTGMTLTLDILSEDNYYQKAAVELSAGTGNYDGLMVGNLQAGQYMAAGWLAPLGDLIGGVVDKGWYNIDDIFQSGRDAGSINGQLQALPISTEAEVVMYRTDLLEAAGLGPIRTFDDLEAAAKAMNKDGVAGIVGRGRRGLDVVWVWTGFFLGLGGEFLTDGSPSVDSDAGVAATELYINRLLKENGPQGTANMSWLEASGVFKEGKAAMYPDASGLVAVVIDKATNQNADKVGVFAWPSAGGAQPAPDYWFWLFGIPAASKNKEAAALFTAWATSPEVELAVGRDTGSPVARASVWADDGFKKFYPGDMAAEISQNLTNVQAARVPYGDPRFPNAADALSVELVNVLTGSKDAATAMKDANAAMAEAMQ